MRRNFLILLYLTAVCAQVFAKVEPPNYNFSVDKFESFMPGSEQQKIESEYQNGKSVFKSGDFLTRKYQVEHIRYTFPIFVQYHKGIVVDFFARLPAYFLHDIFLFSLEKRLGDKKSYYKIEDQGLYQWTKDSTIYTYRGSCSITCFPEFYSVVKKSESLGKKHVPLIDKFSTKL